MKIIELRDAILRSTERELISLVKSNRENIKLLFINAEISAESLDYFTQILIHVGESQISEESLLSEEVQFVYTELAFFFKRSNREGPVSTCLHYIEESILKNRLKAWLHYKHYTDINSHVNLFGSYLNKLSLAISNGEEDYVNEVLRDLNDYYNSTILSLTNFGEIALLEYLSHQYLLPIFLRINSSSISGVIRGQTGIRFYLVTTPILFDMKL
jgi:hypothetical protein